LVQWGDVPTSDQNGVILSYIVTYKALPNGSPQTVVVIAQTTEVTLTGLNEYTNYSITVFASTVKGAGNVSEPITVITDQDSKYIFVFYVYLLQKIRLRIKRGLLKMQETQFLFFSLVACFSRYTTIMSIISNSFA